MIRRARPWLGTIVEIAADKLAAVEAGFAAIALAQARMSFHDPASDLARLRDAAIGRAVAVDPETVAVFRLAAWLHKASGGLFDVTIGRQLVAAGFLPRMTANSLTSYTGTARDIDIVDNRHVRCLRPMLIDLGGIAKGHAVDLAIHAMQASGATYGIVNAGGDLRTFGDADEIIWLRGPDGSLAHSVDMQNTALASSSNLLFRRRARGKIATPHIGRNKAAILSDQTVTVIAPTCAVADAMTKVAMGDLPLAENLLARIGGKVILTPPLRQAA